MDMEALENITTSLPGALKDATLDNLYPALIQCFAVILCGYLAGRWEIVTQEQSSGLNTFVGTFSLPSLIFLSLATLDLSSVNWYFLGSILIAKTIVFASVAVITLLVTRPFSPGRSGLYAIFCTQSNDFAIGFPIVAALYQKTHPEYVSYLYLLAPVSLIILNPFGFVLMEFGKLKALLPGETNVNSTNMAANIARSIATNPIVFMTFFGMITNFLCNHVLPAVLSDILNVFGSAFTGTALFLLGLRMVGKVGRANGIALLVPGILIAVKLFPVIVVMALMLSITPTSSEAVEGYEYGQAQAGILLFIFVISFIVTLSCLVLHQWYLRRRKQYLLLVREANECVTSIQANDDQVPIAEDRSENEINNSQESIHNHIQRNSQSEELVLDDMEENETLRLIVLLVFLLCCIFIRLSMCIWRVIMEDITGVYVELLFLDTSLNRGQSLIVLAVLGLDMKILIQPFVSWVNQIWYGGEEVHLPEWDQLQFETKHVCEQFITHHLDECKNDIVLNRRTSLWRHKQVFSGASLVSWLVTHNIAESRNDAAQYGSHLLYGRLIRHVNSVQLFHDSTVIFYTFITPN